MHFGEYELFPGLIGLSPLSTAHPSGFQPTPVRASSGCYPTFTLAMDRSPGFASAATYSDALFGLAFAPAPDLPRSLTSHVTTTRWLILQKARGHSRYSGCNAAMP